MISSNRGHYTLIIRGNDITSGANLADHNFVDHSEVLTVVGTEQIDRGFGVANTSIVLISQKHSHVTGSALIAS